MAVPAESGPGRWIVYSPYPEHPIFAVVVAGLHAYKSVVIDPRKGSHPSTAVSSGLTESACIHASYNADLTKILREKRLHMAQLLIDVTADRGMALFNSDYLGVEQDRATHTAYVAWQDGYARLKARGLADQRRRQRMTATRHGTGAP